MKSDMVTEDQAVCIELNGVSKRYRLYESVGQRLIDALGLGSVFLRGHDFEEVTALESVSLKVRRGERLGLVGRNGAGKTTLLKLLTGNFAPSSGRLHISAQVGALMDLGLGFHPELSGLQNIRAALAYSGLERRAMNAAVDDVIEFCELGDFLHQPIRTYSAGMRSRLYFAAATAVRPEVLLVDEVLGAGDAYFGVKSAERVAALTSDASSTLILVSHNMGQVIEMCDRAIWLEGGKIEMSGPAPEVVRVYEEFVAQLEHQKTSKDTQSVAAPTVQGKWLRDSILSQLKDRSGALWRQGAEELEGAETARCSLSAVDVCFETVGDAQRSSQDVRGGEPACATITLEAVQPGQFHGLFELNLFTLDGRWVGQFRSPAFSSDVSEGGRFEVKLHFDSFAYGAGEYLSTVSAFQPSTDGNRKATTEWACFDAPERGFRFTVKADDVTDLSLIQHPSQWRLVAAGAQESNSTVGSIR